MPFIFAKLKVTYNDCEVILDSGCGTSRNILYTLKSVPNAFGVDQNPEAIAQLRALAGKVPQVDPEENFLVASVEQLPVEPETFGLVISNAVLIYSNKIFN